MTKKPLAWEDLDLSTRASQAIKNRFGPVNTGSPAEFIAWVNKDYNMAAHEMLRIPNCGRQTVKEIFDELGIIPPDGPKIKIVKFESDNELLAYIDANPYMDVMKLDRTTLQMMLSLVARGFVNVDEKSACTLSALGEGRLKEIRDQEHCEVTIKGTLAQIRDFIDSLSDGHVNLDEIETVMQQLENSNKAVADFNG